MAITRTELLACMKGAINPDFSKFTQAQADAAVIAGILDMFGLTTESSYREINVHKAEIFALIEEVIDEQLPKAIEDVIGGFVETKTFARDAEPIFEIKKIGKARARMSIVEGARGGVYKARRLDNRNFQVDVKVETVGAYVTLEEILLGTVSLAELMANIRDGFVERIYIKTVQALRTAKAIAPAANIESGNGLNFAAIDNLIRIAGAYGDPIIMGFRSTVSQIFNGTNFAANTYPNISSKDADEIRDRGVVTIYKGTPVVELPNYLVDETNAEFIFKEGDLFILPGDAKPVKVAFKGDLHIEETKHPSGSMEQNAHRMVGVGLYLANNICVYTDEDVTGGQY